MKKPDNISLDDLLSEEGASVKATLRLSADGEFEEADIDQLKNAKMRTEMFAALASVRKAERGSILSDKLQNYDSALSFARHALYTAQDLRDTEGRELGRQALLSIYRKKLRLIFAEKKRETYEDKRRRYNWQGMGELRGAATDAIRFGINELAHLANEYLLVEGVVPRSMKLRVDEVQEQGFPKSEIGVADAAMTEFLRLAHQQTTQEVTQRMYELRSQVQQALKPLIHNYDENTPGSQHDLYYEAHRRIGVYWVTTDLIMEAIERGVVATHLFAYLPLESDLRNPEVSSKGKEKKAQPKPGLFSRFR